VIPVAVVLLIVGVAFLAGSAAMQWIGFDPGTRQAPKYVWGEFRRFGRGTIGLGLIALCLTVVFH
jgi:hypothetical protein